MNEIALSEITFLYIPQPPFFSSIEKDREKIFVTHQCQGWQCPLVSWYVLSSTLVQSNMTKSGQIATVYLWSPEDES